MSSNTPSIAAPLPPRVHIEAVSVGPTTAAPSGLQAGPLSIQPNAGGCTVSPDQGCPLGHPEVQVTTTVGNGETTIGRKCATCSAFISTVTLGAERLDLADPAISDQEWLKRYGFAANQGDPGLLGSS